MGFSQSLYTGYSGMHTHQKSMDNISNNLANVNTTGYKKSDFMFTSIFNQAITGAMPGDGDRGTTNPKGLGMGVTTGTIATNFSSTNIDSTGNPLDCAIGGNGFFVVNTPRGTALSRNGSFYLDPLADGNRGLCLGNGLQVQGWNAVDGVVNPTPNVSNIVIPPVGSKLNGQATTEVTFQGVLPAQVTDKDFAGENTTSLELKGDIPGGGTGITTQIYMPVTRNGGENPIDGEIQPVNVRINFVGPTPSEDGTTNNYSWTMTTVDWPNPGDPGIQIYPEEGGSNQTVNFYASGSLSEKHGAGESATGKLDPNATRVQSTATDENGDPVTTFFNVPSDFTIDVSRLTHLQNAPGGNALETWQVDGNPTGTMAMGMDAVDEITKFEPVTDANGVTTMQPVRSTELRRNTLFFQRVSQDESGAEWTWESTLGGDSGRLSFDTNGALTGQQQSGGRISYDFSGMQHVNHEASLRVTSQNGFLDGTLLGLEIDPNGRVWGQYSNDEPVVLAQIAIGTVPNTSGLVNSSGTLFYTSSASGGLMIGIAGDEDGSLGLPAIGAGSIASYALEGSNVNLAQEFSNMISVERGFQFNSRVITTANEMLQTALQLK